MAKTGIKKVFYAKATEAAGQITYSEGKQLSTVAGFNGSPTVSAVVDYGDNAAVESDHSVTGGTLTLEANELTLPEKAFLLGHDLDSETGELTYNSEDVPPYVGVGAIGTSTRGGAGVFVAKLYTKVQFGEPSDDNATKQENVTFSHSTIEGSILMPDSGDWKFEQEFSTEAAAIAYLKGKLNIQ